MLLFYFINKFSYEQLSFLKTLSKNSEIIPNLLYFFKHPETFFEHACWELLKLIKEGKEIENINDFINNLKRNVSLELFIKDVIVKAGGHFDLCKFDDDRMLWLGKTLNCLKQDPLNAYQKLIKMAEIGEEWTLRLACLKLIEILFLNDERMDYVPSKEFKTFLESISLSDETYEMRLLALEIIFQHFYDEFPKDFFLHFIKRDFYSKSTSSLKLTHFILDNVRRIDFVFHEELLGSFVSRHWNEYQSHYPKLERDEIEYFIELGYKQPLGRSISDLKNGDYNYVCQNNSIIGMNHPPSNVDSISKLKNLRYVDFSYPDFPFWGGKMEFPISLCLISSLTFLSLRKTYIDAFPQCVEKMKSLKFLDLSENRYHELPKNLELFPSLEWLIIENNNSDNLLGFKVDLNIPVDYFQKCAFIDTLKGVVIDGTTLKKRIPTDLGDGAFIYEDSIDLSRYIRERLINT